MRQPNVLATLLVAVVTLLAAGPAGAQPRLEAEITTNKMWNGERPPLFTPDGSVVVQVAGSRIGMWNAKNGRFIRFLSEGVMGCRSEAMSPDGRTLATAGECGRSFKRGKEEYPAGTYVLIWNLTAKGCDRVIPIKDNSYVAYNSLCYSPDGKLIGLGVGRKAIIYDAAAGTHVTTVDCGFTVNTVRFDNLSRRVAIGGHNGASDGRLTFLNVSDGDVVHAQLPYPVSSVSFHPKSNHLYLVGHDLGNIRVWDPVAAKEITKIPNPKNSTRVGRIMFSRDGRYFLTNGRADYRDQIFIYSAGENPELVYRIDNPNIHDLRSGTTTFLPSSDRVAFETTAKSSGPEAIQIWSLDPRKAAGSGTLSAADQRDLEGELLNGEPIDENYFEVFGKARYATWKTDANAGCKYGKFLLGCGLMRGTGGVSNEKRGLELIEEAAAAKNPMAEIFLASRDAKDAGKAFERYARAAETKHPLALEYLAGCYREGAGVEKNPAKAFALSSAAAEGDGGIPAAFVSVGVAYKTGAGVEASSAKAVAWFEKAVARAYPDGYYHLGMCFLEGTGAAQDSKRAVELFESGSLKGSHQSMIGLAFCKERGEGCERNLYVAEAMYEFLAARKVKGAAEKLSHIEALLQPGRDARTQALISNIASSYRPLPAHRSGGAADAARAQAIRGAQQSASEAVRDYRIHIGGQLGAQGILPVYLPPGGRP